MQEIVSKDAISPEQDARWCTGKNETRPQTRTQVHESKAFALRRQRDALFVQPIASARRWTRRLTQRVNMPYQNRRSEYASLAHRRQGGELDNQGDITWGRAKQYGLSSSRSRR